MNKILREKIISGSGIKERLITIPEWGDVTVLLRGMSAAVRGEWYASGGSGYSEKANIQVVITCVLDPETKQPVFEKADLDTLMGMSAMVISGLFSVIGELSGSTKPAWAELEKN